MAAPNRAADYRLTVGDRPSASGLNRSLDEVTRLSTLLGPYIQNDGAGVRLVLPNSQGIIAQITANLGDGAYSWEEVYSQDDGTIEEHTDAHLSGSSSAYTAYELSANPNVPVGAVVRLWQGNGLHFLFQYETSATSSTGTDVFSANVTFNNDVLFNDPVVVTDTFTFNYAPTWGLEHVTWASDQTDFVPAVSTMFLVVNPGAATVTLKSLGGTWHGRVIWVINKNNTNVLVLANEHASGTASMRLRMPNSVDEDLINYEGVGLVYSGTDSRWYCLDDRRLATTTLAGWVSTATQSFSGLKNFTQGLTTDRVLGMGGTTAASIVRQEWASENYNHTTTGSGSASYDASSTDFAALRSFATVGLNTEERLNLVSRLNTSGHFPGEGTAGEGAYFERENNTSGGGAYYHSYVIAGNGPFLSPRYGTYYAPDGTLHMGSSTVTGGSIQADVLGLRVAGGIVTATTSLTDPGADRILFWDDSAGQTTWLELGTGLSITGTTLSGTAAYTAENAQDDVAGMAIDTDTINHTYTDGTPEWKWDVRYQMSITSDSSGLKLYGDSNTPGNSAFYGTDINGVRGWYALSSVSYTAENARDDIGAALNNSSTVAWTVDDFNNTITADVPNGSIQYGKIQDVSGMSVLARNNALAGSVGEVNAATNDRFLARVSDAFVFSQLTIGMVPDTLITEAKLNFTDNTTANASSLKHGLLPKLSGSSSDVFRGDGTFGAAPGSAFVFLSSATASSSASVDFTLTAGYASYLVEFDHVAPATDNVEFQLRTSTDGGSTFDASAGHYRWVNLFGTDSGSSGVQSSASDTEIRLGNGVGNAANRNTSGWLLLHNPSAAKYCTLNGQTCGLDNTGNFVHRTVSGQRLSAADVDAIRFVMSSGNIASGDFRLYGIDT
ncbi:MAG TPA: hypothetical protein VEI97_09125 [bacterium]|nr:hypothetical protein [bacterium]